MKNKDQLNLQAALRRLDDWQGSPRNYQRRFKRIPVRGVARLWPGEATSNPPAPITVQVRDISRGGVGLLTNERVERGCFWQLQLIDSEVSIATLPSFCRYCRQVVDGAYLIGVEFGIEASVLLAMGVTAKDIADGDEAETQRLLSGNFVGPESLLDNDAA